MFHKINVIQQPFSAQSSDQHRNNSLKSLKTQQYQSKINQLSNQIKTLRERMLEIQNNEKGSIVSNDEQQNYMNKFTQLQNKFKFLESENNILREQNQKLKHKLKEYEIYNLRSNREGPQSADKYDLQSVNSLKEFRSKNRKDYDMQSKNSHKLSSGASSIKTNLIRQLLIQCNEPKQYNNLQKTDRKVQKDEFYEYKNTEDCFQPFFGALSKQLRIRLKRCLIKQKQLLVVDSNIQLGTICPYKIGPQDSAQYTKMILVITNISLQSITNISLQYVYSNDVSISRKYHGNQDVITSKYKTTFPNAIRSNQQVKQQLQVTINNIDFQSVKLNLSYQFQKRKYDHILILPLSKIKLFRDIPFTSTSKQIQRIQRVFQHQKKILSDVAKLKNIFAFVYESRQKGGNMKYSWKIKFMERLFWIQAVKIQQKLSIAVLFESQRVLAQKILGEYIFLFQKL